MIFSLEVRRARNGDCLLLHFGSNDDAGLIMIDGGPKGVYQEYLKPRLKEIKAARGLSTDDALRVDLLMVSHVDNDHIQGILDLTKELIEELDDRKPQLLRVLSFWHNSFDDIIGEKPDELTEAFRSQFGTAAASGEFPVEAGLGIDGLGIADEVVADNLKVLASIEQGYRLRTDAEKLDFPRNPEFGGKLIIATKDAKSIDMGRGLKMTVVGPMKPEVEALRQKHDEWLRTLKKKGSAQETLAAYVDKSVPNLSSLVVLAEVADKRILLTGDARGDKIIEGLQVAGLMGQDGGGSLHVEVLKVPHHGSSNNLEPGFFERITADHYVFSGNGEYGNPEREALEMLFCARRGADFTVHLTYPAEEIDKERRNDWEKVNKQKGPQDTRSDLKVSADWSDATQGLQALFADERRGTASISIVSSDQPHVIDLLEAIDF
jgi:beta-lactamase superfamily II metal-dependent hydrolase